MKYINTCAECATLWRSYSVYTTDHIRIQGKLQVAAFEHHSEAIPELTLQVEAAEQKRVAARDAIRKHESTSHPLAHSAEA